MRKLFFRATIAYPGNYFDGLIDEVIIARRWFREEEIKALYNRGLNGKEAFGPLTATGIEVQPNRLDFGLAPTNSTVSLPLVLRNTNNVAVTIRLTTVAPFAVLTNSLTLQTNETSQVLVSFNPTEVGVFSNVLVFPA